MKKNFQHIMAVTQWNHTEYAGFEARELWRSESGKSWEWKQYHDTPRWTPPTLGIKLYSQCNLYPSNQTERHMYAMTFGVDVEIKNTSIGEAESAIARVKKIEKKYNEMCKQLGYPNTFAQFTAYICQIIGAELAEYSNIAGDYIPLDVSSLQYKEEKLTSKE